MRNQIAKDLVEALDHPDYYKKPDSLTVDIHNAIVKETERCRRDFIYCAENYFWIKTKDKQDKLLTLNESQMLLWREITDLLAQNRPAWIMILKARQLGCSTLAEAIIAWRSFFFRNSGGLIVSNDPEHSAFLFGMTLHIYDHLPWWMRPQCTSRQIEDQLILDNPNPDLRDRSPGLQSYISVQAASRKSGVGQGYTFNVLHGSEYTEWPDMQSIVESDAVHALSQHHDTIALLESTGKGAGTYAHRFWNRNKELARRANWHTCFLPWFFERKRVLAPPQGWHVQKDEAEMREKVLTEWCRCDNPECLRFTRYIVNHQLMEGKDCGYCNEGTLSPYALTDEQLYFMEQRRVNAEHDEEAIHNLRQELATTDDEAWQVSGRSVFGMIVQSAAQNTVREPVSVGAFDKHLVYHGPYGGGCYTPACRIDHTMDILPIAVWEFPRKGMKYVMGVDVAEGLGGDSDFTIASVIRLGAHPSPDVQVARFRSNSMDTIESAIAVNALGRFYNNALAAVEMNKFDSLLSHLRFQLKYPNLYQRTRMDSENIRTIMYGWYTTSQNKTRIYQLFRTWVKHSLFVIRSSNLVSEMKTYRTDGAGESRGTHDDELMANMIGLSAAHEQDGNDLMDIIQSNNSSFEPSAAAWAMTCEHCLGRWGASSPQEFQQCPSCGSRILTGSKNMDILNSASFDDLHNGTDDRREMVLHYDEV